MAKQDKLNSESKELPQGLIDDPYFLTSGKEGINRSELLNILRRKIAEAEQWLNQKYILNKWGYFYNMYLGKRTTTINSQTWRSNIFIPVVQQVIMDTTPRLVRGMIGKGEFYTINPAKPDNLAVLEKAANAEQELIKKELAAGNFKKSVNEASIWSQVYGIGWVKCDWRYQKEKRKFYDVRKGKDVEVDREEVVWDQPYFTAPDPQNISWDPSAREYEDIGYFVELEWLDVS